LPGVGRIVTFGVEAPRENDELAPARTSVSEEEAMKLTLHHVNLCTTDVPAMDEFYRSVLGLAPEPAMSASRVTGQGYPGDVSFVTDGATQVHLAERDLGVGFRTGKPINPVERGHIAFRTDDIDAFKRRLEAKGIAYADFGDWAMSGWHQIFFHDPEGNVIEVHQVRA
jgi:catechol 2,3-dioxygenase-like lactoylglutathione lyase family enzyme